MSSVIEIENAVRGLFRSDLNVFRDWFLGFEADAWDKHHSEYDRLIERLQ